MIRQIPTRRSPIVKHPPKKRSTDNPEYLAWLRKWPCYICLMVHCEAHKLDFAEMNNHPGARAYFYRNGSLFGCGLTEAAHVGARGIAMRCPDGEAMPLGVKHHRHQTAGGGPESHHTLGKNFWSRWSIERGEVLDELRLIYRIETGRSV